MARASCAWKTGDLRPGGAFHARYIDGGWEGTGVVDACEPPTRFLLTMRDAEPRPGQPDVVEERGLPVDLLAAYGTGVQIHVENLAAHVAGGELPDEARWDELLPAYRDLAARILTGQD
jgi:hypothetical protein